MGSHCTFGPTQCPRFAGSRYRTLPDRAYIVDPSCEAELPSIWVRSSIVTCPPSTNRAPPLRAALFSSALCEITIRPPYVAMAPPLTLLLPVNEVLRTCRAERWGRCQPLALESGHAPHLCDVWLRVRSSTSREHQHTTTQAHTPARTHPRTHTRTSTCVSNSPDDVFM